MEKNLFEFSRPSGFYGGLDVINNSWLDRKEENERLRFLFLKKFFELVAAFVPIIFS